LIWIIAAAAAWGIVVAAGGAVMTELSPWYYTLKKPSWQPPEWLFGPAWTVILSLASIAIYLGWSGAPGPGSRSLIIAVSVMNGIANLAWSPLFFKLGVAGSAAVVAVDRCHDGRIGTGFPGCQPVAAALPRLGVVRHGSEPDDRAAEPAVWALSDFGGGGPRGAGRRASDRHRGNRKRSWTGSPGTSIDARFAESVMEMRFQISPPSNSFQLPLRLTRRLP
jgi:hypothetical protein